MALFGRLTGAEFLSFAGRMYGLDRQTAAKRAAELLDFMQLAERDGLAVAFYESTALGRWSVGDAPRLLDLDVHPRVGVHAAADAERTRSLFDQLAGGCLALRTLRAPVTLHPTVEIWTSRQPPPGGAAPA